MNWDTWTVAIWVVWEIDVEVVEMETEEEEEDR